MMRFTAAPVAALSLLAAALFLPGPVQAREKPVAGVWEMFEAFNTLEEGWRDDKWEEVLETVKKIEADYTGLTGELKKSVDAKTIQKFGFVMGNFRQRVQEKDAEGMEKPFMMLQDLFVDIMESFDYGAPPVLMVAARWVGEAFEELEDRDFDDVAEEMEELTHFRDRIEKALLAEGKAPAAIAGAYEAVEAVEEAARAGDAAKVKTGLETLRGVFGPYGGGDD